MNDLTGTIQNTDTATLWGVLSTISEVMQQRGYKPDRSSNVFMFWYQVFRAVESELDRRMIQEFTEG